MYNSLDIKEIDNINITANSQNMLIDIRDKYEYDNLLDMRNIIEDELN